MSLSPEYQVLKRIIPDLTWEESGTIRNYWRVYWENPEKYSWLKDNVIEWLRNGEGKEKVPKQSICPR